MRKRLSLLLVLSLLLSLFSGCGRDIDNSGYTPTGDAILLEGMEPEDIEPPVEDTQELTLAYYPDRSLNPIFGSDYTNRVLMSLMYQGLFAVDNKKNPTPILCSRYQVSANSRNWTFYLEKGATFSDGTPLTAQDVVATYNQAKVNDYYKNRFFHFINIEVTEDGTGVLFQLDTPYENLPLLLDVPIVKASQVESELPLGTGPYQFVTTNSGATLERVASWWCGNVKIPATDQSIALVPVSSPAEVRDAFQFGDVSVVCANPMSDSFAEYRCDYELFEIESGYMLYIGCNIMYSEHFDDGTLRTFLSKGVNREALAKQIYGDMVETVTLPCPASSPYYNETLAKIGEYDPLAFIDHISRFKIPKDDDNADKKLTIVVNSSDSARVRLARQLAENLTEMGLPAATLECSPGKYKDVIYYQTFDVYLGMTRLSPNYDLTEYFRPYGEMGRGGLDNPNLYTMTLNALENEGNYYNLYKKLAEDGRIIPLMFGYYTVYARRGLIPDLAPSRDNVFYYALGKTMDGAKLETDYTE